MKVIIVGKGSSGKNYLAEELQMLDDFRLAPSWTTRPKREGEIDGKDYNFTNLDNFKSMIEEDLLYEWNEFKNNWFYGTSKEDWNNYNLFIMNPKGVDSIRKEDRKDCFIIFLDISENVRIKRLTERNDNNDSVKRRISVDREDFKRFKDFDLKINNPNFNVNQIYEFLNYEKDKS